MLAKCHCNSCSQSLAFEASDADALVSCPNCGAETCLRSPSIPRPKGEKVGDGDFYVWLDDKPEGPLQSQQLLELARDFPEMAWSPAGGSAWRPLSEFPRALVEARQKEITEIKNTRRKELDVKKKQALELKRDILAKMTEVRNEARRRSAVAGNNWIGLYDSSLAADQRRAIRIQKESALLFLEQQKANADEILAQIEKNLETLEHLGDETTDLDTGQPPQSA